LHNDLDFSTDFQVELAKFCIFAEIWLLLLSILFIFNDLFNGSGAGISLCQWT